ncbi:unnamed protein product [Protopolystoma xenopodis]|uniref:Ku domain-containing protein n=1 Tax=Protopolystoma xenopodis TaxID=117903 RepID=A0A3S5BHV3_9PLAT|nr:unnamed protein product [Protopolystoma xenopodis]
MGATKAKNVPRYLYVGNSTLKFVADLPKSYDQVKRKKGRSKKDSEQEANDTDIPDHPSFRVFSALVHALYELETVLLVRRVYLRNGAPRLGVLMPELAHLCPVATTIYLCLIGSINTTFVSLSSPFRAYLKIP